MVRCKEEILRYNNYLWLTEEEIDAVAQVAERIVESEMLTAKAEEIYQKLFIQRRAFSEVNGMAADIENDAYNGLFWLVVYISSIDELVGRYNKQGIPLEIMSDSINDLALWLRNYKNRYGHWGIKTYPWLWHSFTGRLFRLGRLEFERNEFSGDVAVYRSKITGKVTTLCLDGMEYRNDGFANGTNEIFVENPSVTQYYCDGERAWGNRVDEQGRIELGLTYLDLRDYECVFRKGDKVLEVHIPQGEKITKEVCDASFQRATAFFKEYFDYDFKAFTCFSWLLDPTVGELAGEPSNIADFGKRFTKIPHRCSSEGWKMFVFDRDFTDIQTAPVRTGFQHKVVQYVLNGGRVKEVYGFILI